MTRPKTREKQWCWSEGPIHVEKRPGRACPGWSCPEIHSSGFTLSWSSGLKAAVWLESLQFQECTLAEPKDNKPYHIPAPMGDKTSFLFSQAALTSSFSCVPSCAQQLNQLFLHSSCSGQSNLETDHLVQLSTLLLYDPPAEKKRGDGEETIERLPK